MQQIQFVREGMNNYMVVPCQRSLNRTSYGDTVLEFARISSFMNYEVQEIDGEQLLYYKLKYRTPLRQVLGDLILTTARVKNMVSSIVDVLRQTEEYLLNPECVMWRSDCTFVEIETGKLVFTYHPGRENGTDTIKSFLMELIQYIDKDNSQAYMFIMGFYNLVTNPDCTLEQLIQYKGGKQTADNKRETFVADALFDYDALYDSDNLCDLNERPDVHKSSVSDCFSRNKERFNNVKQSREKSGIGVLILTIVNLLVVFCLLFEIWTYQYIWVLILTIFLLLVALILYFYSDNEEDPDKIMEAYWNNREQGSDITTTSDALISSDMTGALNRMETTVLTSESRKQEIVIEDVPKQLYLKAPDSKTYRDIVLEKGSMVIGSMESGCDYLLSERGISRMHAKLFKKEDGLYLIDLNSTNGTFLNDELIEAGTEHFIKKGDVISFANIVTFVVDEMGF